MVADSGTPVILGIASHDWRDLRREIQFCQNLISKAKNKFPDVPFYFLPCLVSGLAYYISIKRVGKLFQ